MEEKNENNKQIKDKDRNPYKLTDDEIDFVCSLDVKSDFYFASILPGLYCLINGYWFRFIIMFIISSITSEILSEAEQFDWLLIVVILGHFIVTRFIMLFGLRNRLLKSGKFDEQLIAYREGNPEDAKLKYQVKQPNMVRVLLFGFLVGEIIIPFLLFFLRDYIRISAHLK